MGKFLVVFYSHTGTSRQLAQALCQAQSWDQTEIKDREPRTGWLGTLRCVLDSLLLRRPDIDIQPKSWPMYDGVVLVSPIWAYRLAGPMRTFVAQHSRSLPEVAVISVMGSRGAGNAVAEVTELIGREPLLSTAFTTQDIVEGNFASRLDAFAAAIRRAKEGTAVYRPTLRSAPGG